MTIYQVGTSTARATTDTLQYNGVFLDIPFLTCRVVSPTPIAWAIGDFITWNYDSISYRLRDIPSASKQSTSGTYGEAFVYEDVKFYSDLSKTKGVDFLDYTLADPNIHYSSLPKFSFYGKVSDLLERISANMSRLHADWVFSVNDVESGEVYDALNEYKEISVENISCWDAIKLLYSEWGIGFVYSYNTTTSKHTLVAGALGADTSSFSYGQGNGLYIIARAVSKEDSVVTRLRAYGSSENLPSRYYNNLLYSGTPLINEGMYVPNLMIPYTEWGVTSARPDVLKAYIDSNNTDVDPADTSFAKYGIRERSIFFDGNGLKEIKPTIENMTAGDLRTAISTYTGTQTYFTPDVSYLDADRMDLIKTGDDVTDDGYVQATTYYEETYSYTGDAGAEEITGREFTHTITSFAPATLLEEGEYTLLTDGLIVTLGNAEDRDYAFSSLEVFLMKNGNRSALVSTIEGVEVALGELEFPVPNIDFSVTDGGDIYSLEFVISATISDKDYGETTNFAWVISAADFIYRYKKLVPNDRFTIEVRDIGFDVYKFVTAKLPAISMKTGACSGRQFRIRTSEKITGGWRFTCSRQIDDSLGSMYFPNNNSKIAALDQFVLVDLNMPDIYVEIASLRLYNEAVKWLRKNKETQYVYEPKVDEIYMALNPQVIKEGMSMPVVDTDLGIDNTVLINSITINENGDGLRTYDVVLRDGTDETLKGYIDTKTKSTRTETVKYIVNAATPKTQSSSDTRIGAEAAASGYDDSLLWKAVNAKEPMLPNTPTNPTEKFLNGNKEWAVVATGSSGQNKVYLTSTDSDITGYKELSYNPEATTTYCATSLNNTADVLCATYLYPDGVGAEYLDGGTWEFKLYGKVSATAGKVTLKIEVFKRDTDGVETTLFSKYSDEINNLDYAYIPIQYTFGIHYLNETDRIGLRVYGKNTVAAAITLTYAIGDGDASYFTTPLAMRHDNLRDKNGNPDYIHITQGNQSFAGIKTFTGAFTDMVENRNTRLRIPSGTPSGMTADNWYLYASTSGFTGEVPSGGGITDMYNLTDTAFTSVMPDSGDMIISNGTKWVNVDAENYIKTYSDTLYIPLSQKGAALGVVPLDSGGKVALQYLPATLLKYMGVWNASTNTPTLLATDTDRKGQVWNVSVAGTQFGIAFKLGDWLIYNDSGVAEKSDNSDDVTSVNGFTGAVTLTTSNISEGTNLYYTDARVKSYSDLNYLGITAKAADSELLDGNNSTYFATASQLNASNLSSGYLPYWNGSSLGNSIISQSGTGIKIIDAAAGNYSQVTSRIILGHLYADVGLIGYEDDTTEHLSIKASGGSSAIKLFAGNAERVRISANGNVDVDYGGTRSEKFAVKGSGYFDTTVQMAENINTRLRIPSGTPSGLTSGFWYLYSSEGGFTGEVPSGGGVTAFSALTDVSLSGTPTAGQVPMWGDYTGMKLRNTTLTKSHISDFPTTWAWANLTGVPTTFYTLPTATASELGGVKIGSNITITDGVISVTAPHNAVTLGTANGLSLSTQVLSLGLASTSTNGALSSTDWNTFNGKAAGDHTHAFAVITDKPNTISGYGITDAITTGNIGSQSVNYAASAGNADTLDNQHASYFATASQLNAANLSSGYLPYWNGSSFGNSIISQSGAGIKIIDAAAGNYSQVTSRIILGHLNADVGLIGYEDNTTQHLSIKASGESSAIKLFAGNAERVRISANGNVDVDYGGTRSEKFAVKGSGYFNTTVQMAENINTRLRIPKLASGASPSGMTSGQWYIYIQE